MSPDDPRDALRTIADQLPALHAEVTGLRDEARESRRRIGWLTRACVILTILAIGAVSWTAYQQTVLNGKSAAIARLADQDAARTAEDARRARNLCADLIRTRAIFESVWAAVLSSRPDGAKLLARVKAAEPLADCPKAAAGGH